MGLARLCSALSITITGCWRLAPASVADCQFARLHRFLWLASGTTKRHKKGTLLSSQRSDDAVQKPPSGLFLQLRSGANQRFCACRGIPYTSQWSSFANAVAFPAIVPATRRCYAGRECGYPTHGSSVGIARSEQRQTGRVSALSRRAPFRMASIIARIF